MSDRVRASGIGDVIEAAAVSIRERCPMTESLSADVACDVLYVLAGRGVTTPEWTEAIRRLLVAEEAGR